MQFVALKSKSIIRLSLRVVLGLSLSLSIAHRAAAQYGGGGGTGGTGSTGGYSGGGYGSSTGKAIGIGAGAAAGAGLLFLALHHSSVTGCVQPAEDGLRFVDEKKNASYVLVPGDVYLKPGQRVQLQGKKTKGNTGTQTFAAKKLVKDLGSCSAPATTAQAQPTAN